MSIPCRQRLVTPLGHMMEETKGNLLALFFLSLSLCDVVRSIWGLVVRGNAGHSTNMITFSIFYLFNSAIIREQSIDKLKPPAGYLHHVAQSSQKIYERVHIRDGQY